MHNRYQEILEKLEAQFEKVFSMMEFDKDYIEMVMGQLSEQAKRLEISGITNQQMLPHNQIKMLEALCRSGPKRTKYKPIYSQSLVLLVSYFSSSISSIFNDTLTYYLNNIDEIPKSLAKEEFKFSIRELKELEYDLSTEIGRIIARKGDISFQDMQSIYRAFKRYFDIETIKDVTVDNIIVAQSLRHAIVHNAEIIDDKCARQLRVASKRELKKSFSVGESIEVDLSELEIVSNSMKKYVKQVSQKLLDGVHEINGESTINGVSL